MKFNVGLMENMMRLLRVGRKCRRKWGLNNIEKQYIYHNEINYKGTCATKNFYDLTNGYFSFDYLDIAILSYWIIFSKPQLFHAENDCLS